LLPVAAIVAGAFGILVAAVDFYRSVKAERLLVQRLRRRKRILSRVAKYEAENPMGDHGEWARIQELLIAVAGELEKPDRDAVLRPLRQPSEAGRERYVHKVLSKSRDAVEA
jgi:hypothetical protein